jgi:hypothetical protein
MTRRHSLAIASWLVTMAAAAIALGILAATRDTPVPTSWGFRGASEVFAITCGTVGAIVAVRRPDNLNGWLFCSVGLLFAIEGLVNEYVIAGVLVVPGGLPWATALGWLLTWIWVPPLAIALIFLPLLFPTGRLLSAGWRAVAIFGAFATVIFSLALAVAPGPIAQATFLHNPLGVAGIDMGTYSMMVIGPGSAAFGLSIALALSSLVLRFRRSSDDARRQIKWFALAALVAGATFALYLAVSVVVGSPTTTKLLEILVIFALMGIPTAAGMAILRYRLYDIDRIVSRTISYGVVTALLVAVFLLVNLALQDMLTSVMPTSSVAVAASTLLVAAIFTPVRSRVQRTVDRRFDRARFDAERTTVAFSERLRDEMDIATVTADLDRTIRSALKPATLGLWLRRSSQ